MVLFRKTGTHDLFVFATRSCPNILPILLPNYGATDSSDRLGRSPWCANQEGGRRSAAGRQGRREGGRESLEACRSSMGTRPFGQTPVQTTSGMSPNVVSPPHADHSVFKVNKPRRSRSITPTPAPCRP